LSNWSNKTGTDGAWSGATAAGAWGTGTTGAGVWGDDTAGYQAYLGMTGLYLGMTGLYLGGYVGNPQRYVGGYTGETPATGAHAADTVGYTWWLTETETGFGLIFYLGDDAPPWELDSFPVGTPDEDKIIYLGMEGLYLGGYAVRSKEPGTWQADPDSSTWAGVTASTGSWT